MIGDRLRQNQEAYSLVELLVSVAVFIMLITTVVSIFQRVTINQVVSIAAQEVQENVRFTMEMLSKEIRSARNVYVGVPGAYTDDCLPGGMLYDDYVGRGLTEPATGRKVYNVYNDPTDGQVFYFKNKYGDCTYYYVDAATNRFMVNRAGLALPITPDEILISDLEFYIDDNAIYENHDLQSKMSWRMHIEMDHYIDQHELDIQTSISSRYYE